MRRGREGIEKEGIHFTKNLMFGKVNVTSYKSFAKVDPLLSSHSLSLLPDNPHVMNLNPIRKENTREETIIKGGSKYLQHVDRHLRSSSKWLQKQAQA